MGKSSIGAALFTAMTLAWTNPLAAQQPPAGSAPAASDQAAPASKPKAAHSRRTAPSQTNPDLDPDDQLAPSQMKQAAPAPASQPASAPAKPAHVAAARPMTPTARVVACSGAFSKDSSHLRLAMTYDSKNIMFAEVEANGGTKVPASVLFPNDPARRLEVWWSNPAARSGTYLIVIGGKSTWSAPGGMKLGLTIPQLEKLNHKPFKLKGFDKGGVATVSDWDGGALATLPGGCKSGLSLRADPKASPDAVAAFPDDKEFSSSDAAIRAVKPTVSEVLIGYQ